MPKETIIDYQFDELYLEHLIRIVPLCSYDNDLVWDFRDKLDNYFEKHFPNHSLMYLTEDSLVDITRSDYSSFRFNAGLNIPENLNTKEKVL